MAVSRAYKRGNRAGTLRPASRNRRVEWNAGLKAATYAMKPVVERSFRRIDPDRDWGPKPEVAERRSDYETEVIAVTNEDGAKEFVTLTINRRETIIDDWIEREFFSRRQVKSIEDARDLWRQMSMHAYSEMAEYAFDTRGAQIIRDDAHAARASRLLRRARSLGPLWEWRVFENVIRWNEPYGFSGSRLYGDCPKRELGAIGVVRKIANRIADSDVFW